MDLVRAQVERVEVVGLDEAYLDLERPALAERRDATARRRDQARDAADLLGRHRPEQARREGRLRRREAGRLRRAQPRAGVRALRRFAAVADPRHRPEDGRAAGRARPEHARRRRRRARAAADRALRRRITAAELQRRARFEHDGAVGAARKVVSESRERTFDYDVQRLRAARRVARGDDAQLCESLAKNARSGRTIGIKVRLDDWTTVTRARTLPEPTSDFEVVHAVALAAARASTRRRARCACSACASPACTHGDAGRRRTQAPRRAADGAAAVRRCARPLSEYDHGR